MQGDERNCKRCGVPIAPDGLCDFCAMDNLKASIRDESKGVRLPVPIKDILTGPPSADELASAATTCERLRVHLTQKPLYDRNGAKDIILAKNIDALKTATWVLKHILGTGLIVLCILLGCSNDATEERDSDRSIEPSAPSTYVYGHFSEENPQPVTTEGTDAAIEETEEPDAAIEETEEPDAAIEETEEPDAAIDEPEEPDAAIDEPEEPDAAIDEPEEPDAAIDEPEEPDAAIDPQCAFSGTWNVRIVQGTLCISQNDPLVLVIDDCDQTDFERTLDMSDPTFGDFAGSITYHVIFEGQDSLTGTADIVGTVSHNGQELECSSVATISGVKDETRGSS